MPARAGVLLPFLLFPQGRPLRFQKQPRAADKRTEEEGKTPWNYVTQVYVLVSFDNATINASVTASGIEGGEHTVKVEADGIDLKIHVDDMETEKDSEELSRASVPENENPWTFCEAATMPYVEYIKIWTPLL